MIRLRMLPAEDGDCLLLEYGNADFTRRVLVDGGRHDTYKRIRPSSPVWTARSTCSW